MLGRLAMVLLVVGLPSVYISAQVGPFTNNTMGTASPGGCDKGSLEIQFSFESYSTVGEWNGADGLQTFDTLEVESGLGFQFNTGLTDNLEVGFSIPTDISEMSVGGKWNFYTTESENISLGLGVWFDMPLGGRSRVKNQRTEDDIFSAGGGFVGGINLGESAALYADVYYQFPSESFDDGVQYSFYQNADLSLEVTDGVSVIAGYTYSKSGYNDLNNNETLFTMGGGTVVELWENWNLNVFATYDTKGVNSSKSVGFWITITTIFQ